MLIVPWRFLSQRTHKVDSTSRHWINVESRRWINVESSGHTKFTKSIHLDIGSTFNRRCQRCGSAGSVAALLCMSDIVNVTFCSLLLVASSFRGGSMMISGVGFGVDLIKLPSFTYSERKAWANSVDPDQTPQNTASDQGRHCLPLIQQFRHVHR